MRVLSVQYTGLGLKVFMHKQHQMYLSYIHPVIQSQFIIPSSLRLFHLYIALHDKMSEFNVMTIYNSIYSDIGPCKHFSGKSHFMILLTGSVILV